MRSTQGRAGIRVLTLVVVANGWTVSGATASSLSSQITYQTTGAVGTQAGSAGSPVVFKGVDAGSFVSSTPFSLGEFMVMPSANGSVDMPFLITYRTKTVDGIAPSINDTPIILKGRILGTLGDGGQSSLKALFDQGPQFADPKYYSPHPVPPFQTGDLINTINVNGGKEFLTLFNTGNGQTNVEARIDVIPVPEPTTLAILVLLRRVSVFVSGSVRPFNESREGFPPEVLRIPFSI